MSFQMWHVQSYYSQPRGLCRYILYLIALHHITFPRFIKFEEPLVQISLGMVCYDTFNYLYSLTRLPYILPPCFS